MSVKLSTGESSSLTYQIDPSSLQELIVHSIEALNFRRLHEVNLGHQSHEGCYP